MPRSTALDGPTVARRSAALLLAAAIVSIPGPARFALGPSSLAGQQAPGGGGAAERAGELFHTFSIVARDPATGETGAAVTTRNPCVGNGVPWVRAGVGAVATQMYTESAYGPELLDLLEAGVDPAEALARATADDEQADRRQLGVISADGRTAQHTGDGVDLAWKGQRSGANYATQGNVLAGPEVLAAVAAAFEASEGSNRHLADRLIEAIAAGQAAGGDRRYGRFQSAAVVIADPREGVAARPDGVTTNIHVCEHETPVAELRRIYGVASQALGFRTLQQFSGNDVVQAKLILHALGYFRADADSLDRAAASPAYDEEIVAAVDAFREAEGLSTPELGSPRGLIDAMTVERFWTRLAEAGLAAEMRARIRELTAIRR